MPPSREPWIKVKIGYRRSDKLAELPSDGARLGWLYVLLEAKVQRRMGVFAGRAHLVNLVGSYGEYFDAWVGAGLLHVAPSICADCAPRHAHDELRPGDVVVHDYLLEQRDPTNAERQEIFREKQRASANADVTPQPVTPTAAPPADLTPPSVTPQPVAEPRNAKVTPDSRARGTTATATVTETTKKNVSDGEVVAKASEPREVVVDGPLLSDPSRAGRPGRGSGSPGRPAFTVPPAIAALTPQWRTPCRDYVHHQNQHRLVGGQAVCDACETALAAVSPVNGAEQLGLGGLDA